MEGKDNIQRPYKGLFTDASPVDQPEGTYSYALNALNQTIDGDSNFLSMENAIKACTTFPEGTVPMGKCYLFDDNIGVWLSGNGKDYIGILNKYNEYEPFVETQQLGLLPEYPINATFRLRRNNNRVVYWVDRNNVPRLFNFDRVSDFYSVEYNEYLDALQPNETDNFTGEKFEEIHFDLIKRYDYIPEFTKAEIISSGNIKSGSYSIAIQLLDANLSPTEWITTSNPVNIYVSPLSTEYSYIRGSRNSWSDIQKFTNASKSIKWTIDNLDPNFSFYRVAILCANANDGNVNQALVSGIRTIDNNTFTYSGNDSDYTETPLTDIYEQKLDIENAGFIEQLENRLILADISGTQINWCDFQQAASKIKSELVTSTVKTTDVTADGNAKNPITPFNSKIGYMWGEVYSYGIVYVIDGGLESPTFHIPGRPAFADNGMDFYECDDGTEYVDVTNCTSNDYWGYDGWGEPLIGQKVRHHKFPERDSALNANGKTEIAGIQFSNITKPHPKVIGYKIVRNERTEDDKIIVDNVLLGPLTAENDDVANPYHAVGLLAPEHGADDKYSQKGLYIFSPEHQFNNKVLLFDEIKVKGIYSRTNKYVPGSETVGEESGSGAYINDVSPGTSYNPEYHKASEKDPDGFDLHIMYRSNDFSYTQDNSITIPELEDLYYMAATSNVERGGDIFFNASCDNKFMIGTFSDENLIPKTLFNPSGTPRLLYASLVKNNISAYSSFMTRSYYKEHNNMFNFDEDNETTEEIYNGDCYTTPATILSTTYYDTDFADRDKKSRVWKIIVGAVLVIAAIVVNVVPGVGQAVSAALGSAAAQVIAGVTVLALAQGVSMISSGIQFEVMKDMIDVHYEAGLKACIEDVDNIDTKYLQCDGDNCPDDRFMWFADRLNNMYLDSSVNMALRIGLTFGVSDFINSPSTPINDTHRESFEAYLINKLTVIDRAQGDGRLYIGYPSAEWYDVNPDHMRKNKEKIYNFLPLQYDCCSTSREKFPNRVHYSEQSYQEELLDNFRVFLPNNYRDIEGNTGEITNIFRYNNSLYIHTSEALYHLPQNLQEKITSELTTFIGTGEFFAIPPRKVADGVATIGGSKHHQATIVTPNGVFFISEAEGKVYLFTDRLNDLTVGNTNYFKNNLKSFLHRSIAKNIGDEYVSEFDNVFSNVMVGVHADYDARYNRILLTKKDYLPRKPFRIFTGNHNAGTFVFDVDTREFGVINSNAEFVTIPFSNKMYFENKSFTLSYSLTSQMWVSWHSYLPRMYMSTPNNFYSFVENDNSVYLHNFKEQFCRFYNKTYPFIVEVNSVSNPVQTRIWNHIAVNAVVKRYISDYDELINDVSHFFEIMTLNNDKQLSGAIHLQVKDEKTNPEDWFLQQIQDVNHQGIVNRVEDTWFINDFRDYVVDKNEPLFLKQWIDRQEEFPIDKVINQNAIDLDKDWSELESFRGKYLTIRLAYYGENTDNDIQITVNYIIDNEQPSLR